MIYNYNKKQLQEYYQEHLIRLNNLLHKCKLFPTSSLKLKLKKDLPQRCKNPGYNTEIKVLPYKTVQALIEIHNDDPELKILCLNMASPSHFGGGVRKGARAQEEDLFRKTDYPIHSGSEFYKKRIRKNEFVYTPDVSVVCDQDYNSLKDDDFFMVDMIAMSAINRPHTNNLNNLSQEDYDITLSKIENIFISGIVNNCDILVLGALGCGAFRNPVDNIVYAYNECLKKYKGFFKKIVFSVYSHKDINYKIFNEQICKKL